MKLLVKEKRSEKGMSQLELAEKSGVSRATLWKLESNDNDERLSVTVATLDAIANALNVSISDLFLDKNAQ